MFEDDVKTYLQDDELFDYSVMYILQTGEKVKQMKQQSEGKIKVIQVFLLF